MIRLTFFIVVATLALLFGMSGAVQSDPRTYDHQHVYSFFTDRHTVYVYKCTSSVYQLPTTDTWTDGINTMYVVRGQCGEA